MSEFLITDPKKEVAIIVEENMQTRHVDLIMDFEKYYSSTDRIPETVEDINTAQQLTTHIKGAKELLAKAEKARKLEKQEYLDGGKAVDNFFTKLKETLDPLIKKSTKVLTDFQLEQQRIEQEAWRKKQEEEAAKRKAEQEEQERIEQEESKKQEVIDDFSIDDEDSDDAFTPVDHIEVLEAPTPPKAVTKGVYGGVARLKEVKEITIDNIQVLDLNVLKPFITEEVILTALKRYEKQHNDVPKGATMTIKQISKVA